ncbi:hypothetical protein KFK09_021430 [Dendrobium nobile]|uniref:Uncharacterized protein n=1 Tax=Dendrobium nobile TaxID=94219 RepID=A0A8T3AP92_DENNO|nr:hypothetical protein KFK09_021430 [Dendrobium nobile]
MKYTAFTVLYFGFVFHSTKHQKVEKQSIANALHSLLLQPNSPISFPSTAIPTSNSQNLPPCLAPAAQHCSLQL